MGDLTVPYAICIWVIDTMGWISTLMPSILGSLEYIIDFAAVVIQCVALIAVSWFAVKFFRDKK